MMPKFLFFVFVAFGSFSCKAQNPIISLDNKGQDGIINNAYYKDVDNVLDAYVGTWIYENTY